MSSDEATNFPQAPIIQEAPLSSAPSHPASSSAPAASAGTSEIIPSVMEASAITTILDERNAAHSTGHATLLPIENDAVPEARFPGDIALEPGLTIIDEPEPLPRTHRIQFAPRLPEHLGQALLRWGPWAVGIGGAIALTAVSVTTPSWGRIATRAGITLLVAGACAGLLIWLSHLLHQQWTRRWPIVAASLLLLGMLGVAFAPGVHALQGHVLEGQGNYQRAIEEYIASGQHSPDGQDVARSYLEWGQQELRNQNYGMAAQHLSAAAETYSATTAARSAREPLGTALLQWGRQLAVEQRYTLAIQQFERLRTRYADTTAAQQALDSQDEPATRYAWGQRLQADQQFQEALTQFQAIGKLFPNSPYARLAYDAAASDLYAWGQALTQQARYTEAIATYQQILDQYGQAPAAQQARQVLNAPQSVTGRLIFANGAPDARVIIRLSSSWNTGPDGYVQGGLVYQMRTAADGTFKFPSVTLGRYLVDWQQGATFTTRLHQGTYNPVYIAVVEPLRGTDLGDVQVVEQP